MSIYGSLAAPSDDEHEDDCAHWDKTDDGIWEISGLPCSCGQPKAPLVYQGSHVLPSLSDARGGYVDLAIINGHITRNGSDTGDYDGPPHPFLRFGVNEGTVVLTADQVREVHDQLAWFLRALDVGIRGAVSTAPAPNHTTGMLTGPPNRGGHPMLSDADC